MAYIISDIAVLPRAAKRTQLLSCMNNIEGKICKKNIYDAAAIQQKIEQAAEVRMRLEEETVERNSKLSKINFLG